MCTRSTECEVQSAQQAQPMQQQQCDSSEYFSNLRYDAARGRGIAKQRRSTGEDKQMLREVRNLRRLALHECSGGERE